MSTATKKRVRDELSPQEQTREVLDISVTERGQFRTCRRRWVLSTIENLEPKTPTWAFEFGSGMHSALDAYSCGKSEEKVQDALTDWYEEVDARTADDAPPEARDELLELYRLGQGMLRNYRKFDKASEVQLGIPLAVEGKLLAQGRKRMKPNRPAGYPLTAAVQRTDSGRMMVPIVHPETKKPFNSELGLPPCLTARIDLVTERKTPKKGLWVWDRKTGSPGYISALGRALDWEDQLTGYCYVVWRWLGVIPRGAGFDGLIKQEPKAPRVVSKGKKLSTAKDQLTTPDMYRAALKEFGLIMPGSGAIATDDHAACMDALLARGWDPFFKRHEALRSEHELLDFERRLAQEYWGMLEARHTPALQYPNPSAFSCPNCPVGPICRAMLDGSDPESIIEGQYREGEDRKA